MSQTCFQHFIELNKLCNFQSTEGKKSGPTSNSELRRWFAAGCVEINFQNVGANDPYPDFVKSIVMFPKNKKKRCTLFYSDSFTLIQIPDTIDQTTEK